MLLEWKDVLVFLKFERVNLYKGSPRPRWEDNVGMDLKRIGVNRRN
jgi:hypothetical protein